MEHDIVGRHVEISDRVKDYLAEKSERLQKFFDRIHSLKVIISVDGGNHAVELVAHLVKADMVVAKAAATDLVAAIDQAHDKMEAQLRKYKGKLQEHRPRAEEVEPVEELEEPSS